MSRQEDITYDFLESDRIWPFGLAPTSFKQALREVLSRLPDDVYDVVSEQVWFVIEDSRIAAINVPFNRTYPTCPNGLEIRFNTVVVFHQALIYPYKALVGLLAHEIAHCFVSEREHGPNEDATDALALSWGFDRELEALRVEHQKVIQKSS